MNFRVGQKVVCVDADGAEPELRVGGIYTVKAVMPAIHARWRGVRRMSASIHVHEFPTRPGFYAIAPERFRPLIDTTKQVEAIKSLIKPIFEGKTVELVQ